MFWGQRPMWVSFKVQTSIRSLRFVSKLCSYNIRDNLPKRRREGGILHRCIWAPSYRVKQSHTNMNQCHWSSVLNSWSFCFCLLGAEITGPCQCAQPSSYPFFWISLCDLQEFTPNPVLLKMRKRKHTEVFACSHKSFICVWPAHNH